MALQTKRLRVSRRLLNRGDGYHDFGDLSFQNIWSKDCAALARRGQGQSRTAEVETGLKVNWIVAVDLGGAIPMEVEIVVATRRQCHTARPDRSTLANGQQPGPRMRSSSIRSRPTDAEPAS